LEGFASTVTLGQGQIKALEGLEQLLPIAWAAQAERNQIGFCLFWITRPWTGRQAALLESFALLVIRGKGLTLRCGSGAVALSASGCAIWNQKGRRRKTLNTALVGLQLPRRGPRVAWQKTQKAKCAEEEKYI
jgi:hypothetical protein